MTIYGSGFALLRVGIGTKNPWRRVLFVQGSALVESSPWMQQAQKQHSSSQYPSVSAIADTTMWRFSSLHAIRNSCFVHQQLGLRRCLSSATGGASTSSVRESACGASDKCDNNRAPRNQFDPLLSDEITRASDAVRKYVGLSPDETAHNLRFVSISLLEPPKADYINGVKTPRQAECITLNPLTGIASNYTVHLSDNLNANDAAKVSASIDYPKGTQPLFTPEDCDLAETIVQSSKEVANALGERYDITDLSRVACDPWSVNLASEFGAKMVSLVDWFKRSFIIANMEKGLKTIIMPILLTLYPWSI
jgi:hypothetical protein